MVALRGNTASDQPKLRIRWWKGSTSSRYFEESIDYVGLVKKHWTHVGLSYAPNDRIVLTIDGIVVMRILHDEADPVQVSPLPSTNVGNIAIGNSEEGVDFVRASFVYIDEFRLLASPMSEAALRQSYLEETKLAFAKNPPGKYIFFVGIGIPFIFQKKTYFYFIDIDIDIDRLIV